MKQCIRVSLITMFVVMSTAVAWAQAESPTQPESAAGAARPMAARPPMAAPDLLAKTLEQIAATLEQSNGSPETFKQIAMQIKQLAAMLKQPGLPAGDRMPPMPPRSMDTMAGDMPQMRDRQMGDHQREMNAPPMDPLLNLPPLPREMEQNPAMLGVMMQMRGEMMQAVGAVMVKYGKVLAAESEKVKHDASVTQPANPAAAAEQSAKTAPATKP